MQGLLREFGVVTRAELEDVMLRLVELEHRGLRRPAPAPARAPDAARRPPRVKVGPRGPIPRGRARAGPEPADPAPGGTEAPSCAADS